MLEKISHVGVNGEWYHIPSEFNAADRLSRLDSGPDDLKFGSDWLDGPCFLKKLVKDWPIN